MNPFKPPAARLDPALVDSSVSVATWIARVLGAICIAASLWKALTLAIQGTQSGLSAWAVYVVCLLPIASALAGVLVFLRSRHAMAAIIGATVFRLLAAPLMRHLLKGWLHVPDSPFDYGQALFESLHRLQPAWLFDAVVIGFCMWDYRRRFAAWRRDAPSAGERPPVESA